MRLTNGLIFLWAGTNASIPSGWSRVTAMDGKYPKGTADATNPNTTGGAATHSHTSSGSHTHTASAHTHQMTVGANTTPTGGTQDSGTGICTCAHTHATYTSGAVDSFTCSTDSVTYASLANDPPYYKMIYITPTSGVTIIPTGVIALADNTAPTGFAACDGTGSTPNLAGVYLKGADTGGDGGSTGGSTTNIHTLTHTHTTSHGHASATSGGPSAQWRGGGSGNRPSSTHTHSISLPAATPSAADPSVSLSETVEPAYTKLLAIRSSSDNQIPLNIIAMWLGTLAAIPRGWRLCDGTGGTVDMRGRHAKCTATVGEVGDTGGANTHTHSSQNHTHSVAHTHATTSAQPLDSALTVNASGSSTRTDGDPHDITTDSVNLVLANAATAGDSADNEPEYRTVAFLKLITSTTNPSSFFANFVNWHTT